MLNLHNQIEVEYPKVHAQRCHVWRTHSFGFVEVTHTYVAVIVPTKVDEIEGGTQPEVDAWQPHQDGVLEARGEVRLCSIPWAVPILGEAKEEDIILIILFF